MCEHSESCNNTTNNLSAMRARDDAVVAALEGHVGASARRRRPRRHDRVVTAGRPPHKLYIFSEISIKLYKLAYYKFNLLPKNAKCRTCRVVSCSTIHLSNSTTITNVLNSIHQRWTRTRHQPTSFIISDIASSFVEVADML